MYPRKHAILVVVLLLSAACVITAPAQTVPEPAATPSSSTTGEVIALNPFTVQSKRDYGYRKTSSITTSRIGVSMYESPQAVEIISGELLSDLGLNSIRQAFDYTSSVTSNKQETFQSGTFKLRGFELPQYINGVNMAQNSNGPGYTTNDNVERIEIAKGPVGLFYGNSSPNGVANTVTKRPEGINKTTFELSAGFLGYRKALVDTQAVVSKESGVAYRVIASVNKSKSRLNQETEDNMIAASLSFHPNDKIQIQGEFDSTNYKQAYSSVSTWNFMINPLYYQQVAAPDQTMLNYIKTKYGAANDAAALAVIATRWGSNAPKSNLTYLQGNWTADYFGAYGKIAYPYVGTTLSWNRYTPYGNKFTSATPDSRLDGVNRLADASVAITPFAHTAILYHWVHNENDQHFDRGLLTPNAGPLGADGRVVSLGLQVAQLTLRDGMSDTQQLDLSQEVNFAGIKNKFIGGVEERRLITYNGAAAMDLTKSVSRTAPDGTIYTGLAASQNINLFTQPYPSLLPLQASGIVQTESNPAKYEDWYASYRGALFGDKLNLLAGVRNVKKKTTDLGYGQSHLTKSFGAIGQIIPDLYAFASYNTTFQFANSYTAVYTSTGLPVPGDGVPVSPETGKGYEFGFKSALFHDKLSGTVSWFSVERNGVSAPDYIRFTTDPRNLTGDFVRFNTNGGLQRSRGIDGDLVWSPTSVLQVLANFTYISEARILSDPSINTSNVAITEANARQYDKEFHHRISKSPKFSGNLVAKYNFTDGSLKGAFVGGGVRHTGLYSISDSLNYDIYVNAETKFDAFAGYRTRFYGVPTTVQVNLTNIGNKINDVTRDDGFVAQLRVSLQF